MKRLSCLLGRLISGMLEARVASSVQAGEAEGSAMAFRSTGSSDGLEGINLLEENDASIMMASDEHEGPRREEDGTDLGERLLNAAASGDIDTILHLCNDVDVNYLDDRGATALYTACEHGHLAVVQHLLSWPACDIHTSNINGWTSLHVAAAMGHMAIVEYLLQANDSCQHMKRNSQWLADSEDLDQRLPIHIAADMGHADIVCRLIPVTQDIDKRDFDGATPLVLAAGHGMLDTVVALTDAGCDLDERNIEGHTALAEAVSNRHKRVVQHLISFGCRLNVMDVHGYTVLAEAVAQNQVEMVKILIDAGVDLSVQDYCGRTPLHVAILYGFKEISHHLIEAKCNIDAADGHGYTPVYMAAWNPWRRDTLSILEQLAKVGANLDAVDSMGICPLEKALHDEQYVMVLIRHGCNVNTCATPYTIMELAAQDYRFDIVHILLVAGFNTKQIDFSKEREEYQEQYMVLQEICQNPLPLKSICRLMVWSSMEKRQRLNDICKLSLPPILKRYLQFEFH